MWWAMSLGATYRGRQPSIDVVQMTSEPMAAIKVVS